MLEFVDGHPNASLERCDFDVSFREKAFWSEFKYQRDTEIFGEAEPADHVYQIKLGAVRAFDLLADGRRQIGAFYLPGDIFGIETGDAHRFTSEAIVNTTVWIAKRRSIFGEGVEENISSTKDLLKLITRNLPSRGESSCALGSANSP